MAEPVLLYIVVPCYNEEAVLPETARRLLALLAAMQEQNTLAPASKIVFVDDGSRDKTWALISELSEAHAEVEGVKLAKNAGHQNALLAGLMAVRDACDCAVSIDADLQDDINAIPAMVQKYIEGNDVVYAVRSSRQTDTAFKRQTALLFYKLMRLLGVNMVYNHADYRLMSRRALAALAEFSEVNLFLRGLVPLVGFRSASVPYVRQERFAGESKYPLKKMLSFAFDGITSFSVTPIRFISALGVVACVFSVIMAVYAFIVKLMGHSTDGWSSLMLSIWFLGGVQLISVGLIGEYIGKIYKEVKRRPRYIIEEYKKE